MVVKFAPIISFLEILVAAFIMLEVFLIDLNDMWDDSRERRVIMLSLGFVFTGLWMKLFCEF